MAKKTRPLTPAQEKIMGRLVSHPNPVPASWLIGELIVGMRSLNVLVARGYVERTGEDGRWKYRITERGRKRE